MSEFKDLTGQRFGKLKVINRAKNNTCGRVTFNCQCDCGNQLIVSGNALLRRNTSSCGCNKYKKGPNNPSFKNISNQKFGLLTAISYHGSNKDKTYWLCKCDCGNNFIAWQGGLSNGTIKSCGCNKYKSGCDHHNFKNLIGQKFGKLTVLSLSENKKNNHSTFICRCDCGNIKEIIGTSLTFEHSKSCGCEHYYKGKMHHGFKGYEEVSGAFMTHLKFGAKIRNLIVDPIIDAEYIWNLLVFQNKICVGTGLSLNKNNFSVDRIDSTLNYIPGNLQMVHKDYNRFKWRYSTNEIEGIVKKIIEFNGIFIPRLLEINFKNGSKYFSKGKIHSIKTRYNRRNRKRIKQINYFLTNEQLDALWEKQQGRCAYTGIILNNNLNRGLLSPSLDRIDSNHHYIFSNVEWILPQINLMKNKFSKEYFLKLCSLIYNYKSLNNKI